jgi:hypothetical protein
MTLQHPPPSALFKTSIDEEPHQHLVHHNCGPACHERPCHSGSCRSPTAYAPAQTKTKSLFDLADLLFNSSLDNMRTKYRCKISILKGRSRGNLQLDIGKEHGWSLAAMFPEQRECGTRNVVIRQNVSISERHSERGTWP